MNLRKPPKPPEWDEALRGRVKGEDSDEEWDRSGSQSAAQGALIWFFLMLGALYWLLYGPKFPR